MDCSNRLYPVLIQAFIQLFVWHYGVKYTKSYVLDNCTQSKWFIQWCKKPDGMGGEFGQDRIISQLGHFFQAWIGGILLTFAYYLSSPQLFIMGALTEFAVELLDVKEIIIERYILNKGVWSVNKSPTAWVILILAHHSGAFLSILPACIYYADNPYVQQIGLGLLGFAAFFVITGLLSSSRNVYDLQERGQFTVISVINFIGMVYFRWIVACPGIYWFLYHEWNGMPLFVKILMLSYLILFKLFDLWMLFFSGLQVYAFLFGGKAMKKPTKITIASLKRAPSVPINLIRMCSAPIFNKFD